MQYSAFVGQLGKLRPIVNRPSAPVAPGSGGRHSRNQKKRPERPPQAEGLPHGGEMDYCNRRGICDE